MKSAIHTIHASRAGFTLVEIMLVVAIIGLLAAIAVPNYQRSRKRTQASIILSDLRLVGDALDRWAIDNKKSSGDTATMDDLKAYLKTGTSIYVTGRDLLGHEFGPVFTVDVNPVVPPDTFAALSEVAPPEFWSPFY